MTKNGKQRLIRDRWAPGRGLCFSGPGGNEVCHYLELGLFQGQFLEIVGTKTLKSIILTMLAARILTAMALCIRLALSQNTPSPRYSATTVTITTITRHAPWRTRPRASSPESWIQESCEELTSASVVSRSTGITVAYSDGIHLNQRQHSCMSLMPVQIDNFTGQLEDAADTPTNKNKTAEHGAELYRHGVVDLHSPRPWFLNLTLGPTPCDSGPKSFGAEFTFHWPGAKSGHKACEDGLADSTNSSKERFSSGSGHAGEMLPVVGVFLDKTGNARPKLLPNMGTMLQQGLKWLANTVATIVKGINDLKGAARFWVPHAADMNEVVLYGQGPATNGTMGNFLKSDRHGHDNRPARPRGAHGDGLPERDGHTVQSGGDLLQKRARGLGALCGNDHFEESTPAPTPTLAKSPVRAPTFMSKPPAMKTRNKMNAGSRCTFCARETSHVQRLESN